MEQRPSAGQILEEQRYQWSVQGDSKRYRRLPPYDKALGTRKALLCGLILSLLLSIAGLAIGIYGQVAGPNIDQSTWLPRFQILPAKLNPSEIHNIASKAFVLLFTIVVLVCTECLGYIHSTTLRWALAKEGRLEFNSNLRLFSSARTSVANGRCANFFSALCMTFCYAGVSACLVEVAESIPGFGTVGSGVVATVAGLITASTGLLGLCIITGVGWIVGERSGTIKSWNPHPLNTALACLQHQSLFRNIGRATLNASQRHIDHVSPQILMDRQPSALQTVPKLKHINRFTIAMSCVFLCIAIILLIVILKQRFPLHPGETFVWVFFPVYYSINGTTVTNLLIVDFNGPDITASLHPYMPLVWFFASQSISTITFHIIELLVNLRRDETGWRKLAGTKGASFNQNAFRAAFSNKGSVALFCLKPLGQWFLILGLYNNGDSLGANPLPLLVFAGILGLMALVTVLTSKYKPKGHLPSTYGHLQTIADIVDDWGQGANGRLFWSDKGEIIISTAVYRRAGTAGNKNQLDQVAIGAKYSIY